MIADRLGKRAFRVLLSTLLVACTSSLALPAFAFEDEPKMNVLLHGGYGRTPRGGAAAFGYSMGFSIDNLYGGAVFSAMLGPSETTGIGSDGKPAYALDTMFLLGFEAGYEQVVDKHFLFRPSLTLGGLFWSREIRPDSADRMRANGFMASPGVLVGGLFGPVLVGIEQRGVFATVSTDHWSFATLLVIGGHYEMPR